MHRTCSIFAATLALTSLSGFPLQAQESGQLPEQNAPATQANPGQTEQNRAHASDIEAAKREAGKWLKLVDAGKYDESWKTFAPSVRRQVTAGDWDSKISATRSSFGALETRSLQSADYKTTLPGAPDGEYVVLTYASRFAHKASTIETAILQKEGQGWHVAGYFMR